MTSWSIAIKTVGSHHRSSSDVPSAAAASSSSKSAAGPSGCGSSAIGTSSTHSDTAALSSDHRGGESNFTIEVDPDDPIHSLHEKIERVTGLRAEQQRLIYRGRIINSGRGRPRSASLPGGNGGTRGLTEAERLLGDHGVPSAPQASAGANANDESISTPRVRDVSGLCDQQTIHLVPRPAPSSNNNNANNNARSTGGSLGGGLGSLLGGDGGGSTGSGGGSNNNNVASLSGEAGMSLLAALLGLGSSGGGGGGSNGGSTTSNNSGPVMGSTEGLGGIVERAVMMGVLDDDGGGGDALGLPPTMGTGGILGFASGSGGGGGTNNGGGGTRIRGTTARESETFPRLANLGNTARRTMSRRNRNSNASAAARARASAARLTESDIRAADPGSVEPVRQGMLTLHTLLGNARLDRRVSEAGAALTGGSASLPPVRAPLDSRRRWYRGQWLDALDTVNQWLEATVVDIVLPSDVLPSYGRNGSSSGLTSASPRRRTRRSTPDAVVSANDLEGRRRLLLEPVPDDEVHSNSNEIAGLIDLLDEGYRPRPDNDSVQLLLIHYNGWPHRWDEWIRSDSERIRPFRTRTRHRGGNLACPTPQAVFGASPSTAIRDEDDRVDERTGMLGELSRVLGGVHEILDEAIGEDSANDRSGDNNDDEDAVGERDGFLPAPDLSGFMAAPGSPRRETRIVFGREVEIYTDAPRGRDPLARALAEHSHLPWRTAPAPTTPDPLAADLAATAGSGNNRMTYAERLLAGPPDEVIEDANDEEGIGDSMTTRAPTDPPAFLDENGLPVDPVRAQFFPGAYRRADEPADEGRNSSGPQLDAARLRQLAPLLDRLGRALTDAAPHVAALADALPPPPVTATPVTAATGTATTATAATAAAEEEEGDPIANLAARASRLYFGLGDNEESDTNATTVPSAAAQGLVTTPPVSAATAAVAEAAARERAGEQVVAQETASIVDPDLTDYVNGMVNTTRGGNAGRGSRDGDGSRGADPIGTSLLASYLSSLGGGSGGGSGGDNNNGGNGDGATRLVRLGGGGTGNAGTGGGAGGGPGIDIHIHAIVTGPGGLPPGGGGGLGGLMDNIGGGATTNTATATGVTGGATRNNDSPFINHAARTNDYNDDDDDNNLFSELYSESPTPINLHGDEDTRIDTTEEGGFDGADLGRMFDDVRSIEDDDEEEEEAVEASQEEVESSFFDSIPCCADADSVARPNNEDAADDAANLNENRSEGTSESLLVLSEIDSQESGGAPPATPSQATPPIASASPSAASSRSSRMGSRSSPFFGSRLFRRTLGRLPGSSSRNNRSGNSSGGR